MRTKVVAKMTTALRNLTDGYTVVDHWSSFCLGLNATGKVFPISFPNHRSSSGPACNEGNFASQESNYKSCN
uniref:Uncharacterized protein n=1 Tax=Arundo donax TaxID=35708 RepID=A0A0A8XZD5_ARUDO